VRENIRPNREIEDHALFARKLAIGVLGAMQWQGNTSASGRAVCQNGA
jgi:hypothetical protein